MSGVVKSASKVFKKVTKSSIGKLVVGAAVAYFTAGLGSAVLGATGLSLSPTMTTVLSHALSGSVAGGITSALTGDSIGKGLALGGVGGAVMGGVQSMLGNYTPGSSPAQSSSNIQNVGPGQSQGIISQTPLDEVSGIELDPAGGFREIGSGVAQQASVPIAQQTNGPTGLLSRAGDWIEKNPDISGKVIGGAATGALAGVMSPDYSDVYEERNQIERDKLAAAEAEKERARQSHSGSGLLTQQNVGYQGDQPARQTRTQKWAYRYDPATNQIVQVPV